MNDSQADRRALDIAHYIHKIAAARQTFLFGSRARGDYRDGSDIDLLVVTRDNPPDSWLESLRQQARKIQKTRMPEASGIDIIQMPEQEFLRRTRLRNNIANTIIKEGRPVMPDERLGYRNESEGEDADLQDVEQKMADAIGAANWIEAIAQAGIIDLGDDRQFGRIAQNALEFAYAGILAAHGRQYPTSGRDGHNLTIMIGIIREHGIFGPGEEIPGERHHYLSEFGGAAACSHEHPRWTAGKSQKTYRTP